jgi:hypothetical protein
MDTQTLELVGRHRLASELLQAGLEVAFPARDRGIDLIAYLDIDSAARRFAARPIQMKAASQRSFSIDRKYEKFHDLILAFVWHVDGESPPETYALTYAEANAVGEAMGWLGTSSWIEKGAYSNTQPGKDLCRRLDPYRMTPEAWRARIAPSRINDE